MAKYCKKPVEIEAIQWNGANETEIKKFVGESAKFTVVSDAAWEVNRAKPIAKLEIETLEGTMAAQIGDFIIRGVDGEFYPCKPNIFERTYDEVNRPQIRLSKEEAEQRCRRSVKTMPKCRDCLHWEVCTEYQRAFWGHRAQYHSPIVNASTDSCTFYKDRSRFVELSHAEWVEDEDMYGDPIYHCSNCNEHFVLEEGTPTDNCYFYCPNCGAKMDEQALKERKENGNL